MRNSSCNGGIGPAAPTPTPEEEEEEEEEEEGEEEFIACMSFVFFMDRGCFLILISSA